MSTNLSILFCLLTNALSVSVLLITLPHYSFIVSNVKVLLCRIISGTVCIASYFIVESVLGSVPAIITVMVCWMTAAVFIPFSVVLISRKGEAT